jgi:hypothetical protein
LSDPVNPGTDDSQSLLRRLHVIETRQEGIELLSHAARTIDLADPDEWLDCFTQDGAFRYQATTEDIDTFDVRGVRALRQWFVEHRREYPVGKQAHLLVNPVFLVEGDAIQAISTYFTLVSNAGSVFVASHGTWKDSLVRCQDDRLRIHERRAIRFMAQQAADNEERSIL